jgi:hypothetical protein
MDSADDTRCRVGCPIRISTDQRLLAAPRGFSQRATSFIASWCQGIHRMPFLYSISRTHPRKDMPHHAQKPSSGIPPPGLRSPVVRDRTCHRHPTPLPATVREQSWKYLLRTQQDLLEASLRQSLARSTERPSDKIVHTPLNPRRRPLGRCSARMRAFKPTNSHSRSDIRPNDGSVAGGQSSVVSQKTAHVRQTHKPQYTRPETHQNLIYISKEQHDPLTGPLRRRDQTARDALPEPHDQTEFEHPRYLEQVCQSPAVGFQTETSTPDT